METNGHRPQDLRDFAEAFPHLQEAVDYLRAAVLAHHGFAYGWFGQVATACLQAIRSTKSPPGMDDPLTVSTEVLQAHAIEVSETAAMIFMVGLFGSEVESVIREE